MQQLLAQMVANPFGTFALLSVAALLEVLADSWFHSGLHASSNTARALAIATGIILVSAYGLLLNMPRWDFGKLIGIYVGLFFLVAQAVAKWRFHESPTPPVIVGGTLIVAGGLVIAFWKG